MTTSQTIDVRARALPAEAPPTHVLEPLLTVSDVLDLVPFSKSTLYKKIRAGTFPKPLPISDGRVAWRSSAIARWMPR
jgi:prophage regulatory protein